MILFRVVINNLIKNKEYLLINYKSDIGEYLGTTAIISNMDDIKIMTNTGIEIPLKDIVRVGEHTAPGYQVNDYRCGC